MFWNYTPDEIFKATCVIKFTSSQFSITIIREILL